MKTKSDGQSNTHPQIFNHRSPLPFLPQELQWKPEVDVAAEFQLESSKFGSFHAEELRRDMAEKVVHDESDRTSFQAEDVSVLLHTIANPAMEQN